MIFRRAILFVSLFLVSFISADNRVQDIPIPEEWDTYFVCFLLKNLDYVPSTKEAEKQLSDAHIQYQLQLQLSEKALAAGGLGASNNDSVAGLTILRANSLAEAQKIMDKDPAVRTGRFIARVREWWVPAGRLP